MDADEVIKKIKNICEKHNAKVVILYGSRAKNTYKDESDFDIAVSGVRDFDRLQEELWLMPTLYSVDLLNLDNCKNEFLMEDIKRYGREIWLPL